MSDALPPPEPIGEIETGHHRVRVVLDVTVRAPTLELAIAKLREDYRDVEDKALACSIEAGPPRLYPDRTVDDLERSLVTAHTLLSCVIAEAGQLNMNNPDHREEIAKGVGKLFDQYKPQVARALLKTGQRAEFNAMPIAEVIQ